MRVSVTIRFAASITNSEAYGAIVAVYCDNMGFTLENVATHPFAERYMLYHTMYYNEAVMQGELPAAANANGYMVREFDIKARRRLQNIEDTLILDIAGTGGLASLQGVSWSASTLMSLGRR